MSAAYPVAVHRLASRSKRIALRQVQKFRWRMGHSGSSRVRCSGRDCPGTNSMVSSRIRDARDAPKFAPMRIATSFRSTPLWRRIRAATATVLGEACVSSRRPSKKVSISRDSGGRPRNLLQRKQAHPKILVMAIARDCIRGLVLWRWRGFEQFLSAGTVSDVPSSPARNAKPTSSPE